MHFIDVGREVTLHDDITVSQDDLVSQYGKPRSSLQGLPRSEMITFMASCATKHVQKLYSEHRIHAIITAGGSGGTSLASAVMRDALPIGFPKLIVSTVASGDTSLIIAETDITLMYSVVDIAGLNGLLKSILTNAASAIAGMSKAYLKAQVELPLETRHQTKTRIGITMFGVTTPCVDAIRRHLESNYDGKIELFVFHATGHGGRSMERLVEDGKLDAVLDLTTTEICDLVTGGNMSAGPRRLEAAAKAGIPNIVSIGALDMSNFGAKSTVPERYKDRLFLEHNAMVTLMRTSSEEYKKIGKHIVEKLVENAARKELIEVWLPKGGMSLLSVPEGPFNDQEADRVLFETIREGLMGSGINVVEDHRPINDEGFATDIAQRLAQLCRLSL